ncbi:MAG: gliding motility-associated C-terminal domain-containing protein [Flavobacteriales bacterium]|nr:gliding motility-associated C-terminal domain-containing protein [Flavobacteriales bacterium]
MRLFLFSAALLAGVVAHAQCGIVVGTFPYQEGFEAAPAWLSGGTGNDWAWGTPAKPTINSAGGGTKSWCVGGLTGSFYTYGEQSWLEGPCFDFSALPYPYVSFKIFWECERTYDGLGFQYSLDQGNTWSNVGTVNDPATCFDQNWFNTPNINNLNLASPKQGWSGRIGPTQGSCAGSQGSLGWVTASHCLADLAGEPSVKFRFIFGAGTTCNSYDGIAIDDVYIGEAPPEPNPVQWTCFADTLAISGVQTCASTLLWDFGDPASGAANTSSAQTPQHVFSTPGAYTVTLSLFYSCRSPQVVTLPVNILGLQLSGTDPTCAGNDGSVSAAVSGASAPIIYLWNPGGASTSAVSGLGAGTYNFVANSAGSCPTGGSVTLAPPSSAPTASITTTPASCNGFADGSASVTVNGGTPGYSYSWSPNGGSGPSANSLSAGTYTCTITDASSCSTTVSATVTEPTAITLAAADTVRICAGDATTLQANAAGGSAGYIYTWSPSGPDVSPAVSTTFTVVATDANGCVSPTMTVEVIVGSVATPVFTVTDTIGCSPHCAGFSTSAANGTFTWDMGDGTVLSAGESLLRHCYAGGGVYDVSLTVSDASGCSGTWALAEAVHVLQTPVAAFLADPPVTTIKDPLFQFINLSSGADSVRWLFGDPADSSSTSYSPAFAYAAVGCYEVDLYVASTNGCTNSIGQLICVEDEFGAYVPNAFTPNGDGINDAWGVITTVGEPRAFELIVFDRWGGVIFRSTDKRVLWGGGSGGEVPIGVYPWRLRLRDSEDRIQERTGHVTLLR